MTKLTRRKFFEDSLLAAAAVGAAPLLPGTLRAAESTSRIDPIRAAVIGVRGRGRSHVGSFKKNKDTEVVGICDADEGVIGLAMKAVPNAKYVKDIRKLLEDDSIDVVSIATPNHWHSLAAIWAMQAGKHVYVEKPLSHNVYEGRKLVEAARKYGRIVQHGTQARSTKATRDAMEWLRKGGLGKVRLARALCYKRRKTIGKVSAAQQPPETCDYDLWTGPAEMQPLMRKSLHYDWHWVFNTGNGDMGNQGVHQMDIARWGLGVDRLPDRVVSLGGRLGYDDDGNTPNTQISLFDYGEQQLIFEVRGLETPQYKGAHVGVVFHCEHGYLVSGSYGRVVAFDHTGKKVKEFRGGGDHFVNFIEAVKAGDPSKLTAESHEGHLSSALCHLGNISYKLGSPRRLADGDAPFGDQADGNESFLRFREHLTKNGVDAKSTDYVLGPSLAFDAKAERFTGDRADRANELVSRPYRQAFSIPAAV